jgi:hypothetical protein
MGDDGKGSLINIPSIFISESNGDKLLKYIKKESESKDHDELKIHHIMLIIDFNVIKRKIS